MLSSNKLIKFDSQRRSYNNILSIIIDITFTSQIVSLVKMTQKYFYNRAIEIRLEGQ